MSDPWFKFYPPNWRGDPALRMCSLSARGLWMEMLCLMHEASPRGFLLVNERPVTERQLAALAGLPVKALRRLLSELERARVFYRGDDGVIGCRWMIDETFPYERRPPRHEWRDIRTEVFRRDDFTCSYCGQRGGRLECDHVVPVARGGGHEPENLTTACYACNRAKGTLMLDEWRHPQ